MNEKKSALYYTLNCCLRKVYGFRSMSEHFFLAYGFSVYSFICRQGNQNHSVRSFKTLNEIDSKTQLSVVSRKFMALSLLPDKWESVFCAPQPRAKSQ